MIHIQEITPPLKVSGISSFLVTFPYREDIVQAVKGIPNALYHKKTKLWEIPSNYLSKLLDALTFLDDIELHFTEIGEISKLEKKEELTDAEIAQFKFKPFKHQIEAINYGLAKKDKWLLLDSMGLGKALSLDTRIYTPIGYTTMGQLNLGDYVFGEDGKPTKVIGIYDHKNVEMYKITFSDGQVVEACKDHQWTIADCSTPNKFKTVSTEWFVGTDQFGHKRSFKTKSGNYKYRIPLAQPIQFEEQPLPLDPYVVGVLLGDGYLGKYITSVSAHKKDFEIFNQLDLLLPHGLTGTVKADPRNPDMCEYVIRGKTEDNKTIRDILADLGIQDKRSDTKFIPSQYLYNTVENRLKLLQGLLDTDGCYSGQKVLSFATISEQLKNDVVELCNLLGGVTTVNEKQGSYLKDGVRHNCHKVYELSIRTWNSENCFRLTRKKNKVTKRELSFSRSIKSVEKINKADARCITVDNPSHLYVIKNGIVTHNTLSIIGLAETLKRRGLIEHCLIICGVNALKQNWKKEIQKYSTETCMILGEKISKKGKISYSSISNRAEQLLNPIEEFFIITNVETIRDDRIVTAFNKSKNEIGLIAFDEVHRLASRQSQQSANMLKLKSKYKVGATGTLITNNPISCYVPLAWTENDHATLTMYKAQYCRFGGFNNSQVIGYKNLDLLKDELDNCSLRRTLDEVRDMPPKTVTYELLEMDDQHRKFYEAIKDGVKEEADKIELRSNNLLALTTRLRQATSCPSVLTTQIIPSTKVERCKELVEDLVAQGEKVVILSIFKETVAVLKDALAQYNPMINTGDTSDQEVSSNVDRFQNSKDPDTMIFIGTWAKVATGLTLNAAQYLICVDTPYTYAMFSQGTDRIWRVNNTRPAFITVLACKDSIDERVMQIVDKKKELSDFIIDDVNNELAASMQDELRSIITDL